MQCLNAMLQMNKKVYDTCLGKLNRYAKSKGLTIYYSDTFAYLPQESIILLNKKDKGTITLLLYYLHELGHAIQNDSYFHKLKRKSINVKRSIILEQEYTAWVNGTHIAMHLNIFHLFNEEYLKEWVSAWSEYTQWLHKANQQQVNSLYTSYIAEGCPPIG
jgi:hypothetical protein